MPAMKENIAGNIFLIGLMGAGKTTLGKQLAEHLQRPFYDSDQIICNKTGVSVPTIFEVEGEAGFRQRECAVIDELSRLYSIVLATGGGAILNELNRRYLQTRGICVYLHVEPEILFTRTIQDRNRPLLQTDNPLQTLQSLYQQRDPIYRQTAHYILDIGEEKHNATLKRLFSTLSKDF